MDLADAISQRKSSYAIIVARQRGEVMEGIQFVTNDKGKKVAVQIDLERHGRLWEDIHDRLVAEERANDKSLPYETVRKRLVRSGKLRA